MKANKNPLFSIRCRCLINNYIKTINDKMPDNQILGKMIIILMADTNYDSIELPLIGSSEKINKVNDSFHLNISG